MVDYSLVRSLGIIIVFGAAFALAARLVKMPSIVAYLAAGIVIGPVFGLVQNNETLELMSHVGIALLLFLVGLEISFEKVRDVGRVAAVTAIIQVLLTALGAYALASLLGLELMPSLFLAAALTFSSTVVVVKLLGEKNELNTIFGRIAIGILLVQDLIAIILLTFLSGFGTQADATPAAMVIGLLRAFGGMALLLAFSLFAARYLLPRPFAWIAGSPDALFIASLAWCFLLSLGAETLHLSLEIGAFLAGIALAQIPYNQELHRRVHPLMNFFIAVFFVSLGLKMEISPANVDWLAAGLLALFVMLAKPLMFTAIISRMGYSPRTSFLTGLSLAQISEFSFILVALGMASGLIGAPELSLTALVGLMTFAGSSYMILYNNALFETLQSSGLLKLFAKDGADHDESDDEEWSDHIIVIGMNSLGREIAVRLHERGETVLAIDTNHDRLQNLPCETMLGSVEYLSLLLEAGLPRARLVVSALTGEEANDLLAFRCSTYGVKCSIHVIDLSVIDNLLSVDTTYLMIPKVDGIKLQTRYLKTMGFIQQ
jgi:Kef-type K+ transport system membrane component KefB